MPLVSRTQEIADTLRDEILRGHYRTGERLPSERDLAQRFGVNRGITRVALKKLEQLGIADVQSAGARVAPIDHASLEVVGHLLDLNHPPDPELAAQVLEVYRGVAALALRFGVERASDEQIAHAIGLVDRMTASETSDEEIHELEVEISKLFVDASENLVLKLLRRGISVNFITRLNREAERPRPSRAAMRPSMDQLRAALETRDSVSAASALDAGMALVHDRVLATIRSRFDSAGGSQPASR